MAEDILRNHGIAIIQTALDAVNPEKLIRSRLAVEDERLLVADSSFDLTAFQKIVVIGGGKAGAAMAKGLEAVLGDRIDQGLVVVKDGHTLPTEIIEIREASHPVPDGRSEAACAAMLTAIRQTNQASTLYISLLSGGASSLLAAPISDISLEDKQRITSQLLECGADIKEINTVRKHLSRIKGGRLAQQTWPAQVLNLVLSDVIGDDLQTIGSGPFSGDSGTWADCLEIVSRYEILDSIPKSIYHKILQGFQGFIPETPFPGERYFKKVSSHILGSNHLALQAAADAASDLGYKPFILKEPVTGEASEAALKYVDLIRQIRMAKGPIEAPCCLLSGGETTVTLGTDFGKGGRNQEFALAAVRSLADLSDITLFSVGTDGSDGPTDAAGAVVTGSTATRAQQLGLSPEQALAGHDAYSFFDDLGDLVKTGPTLTNVMDLQVTLIG